MNKPRHISGVIFDLDDTLYDISAISQTGRMAALNAMLDHGLDINVDEAYTVLQDIIKEFGSNYEHHFNILLRRLQVNDTRFYLYIGAAVAAYHDSINSSFAVYPDVRPTLADLRNRKKKLCILTDGPPAKQCEKIVRLGISPLFDEVIVSDEERVAIRKPNPELFRRGCEILGLRPDLCMYVGDRYHNDIVPAHKAGLVTVLIHRGGKYDICQKPNQVSIKPDFEINNLSDIVKIIDDLESN